jgi:hypothetical protein
MIECQGMRAAVDRKFNLHYERGRFVAIERASGKAARGNVARSSAVVPVSTVWRVIAIVLSSVLEFCSAMIIPGCVVREDYAQEDIGLTA